jgi:hypothetical protein
MGMGLPVILQVLVWVVLVVENSGVVEKVVEKSTSLGKKFGEFAGLGKWGFWGFLGSPGFSGFLGFFEVFGGFGEIGGFEVFGGVGVDDDDECVMKIFLCGEKIFVCVSDDVVVGVCGV